MKIHRILGIVALSLFLGTTTYIRSTDAQGSDVFSLAVCDNPHGKTFYYDAKKAAQDDKFIDVVDEGYVNDPPSFIIDTRDATTIFVKWGQKESQADILSEKIDEQGFYQRITAVEAETNYSWMYSLFPREGIAFITRQGNSHKNVKTLTSTFFTFCDFQ
ncbi:MAG: hypothetical protein ACTSXQ_01770 [Alphaproteobacteria bacterium]